LLSHPSQKPGPPASSWTGRTGGGLVRQGPDGRGGQVRLLAPKPASLPAPGVKRPLLGSAQPAKHRKHQDPAQLKVSSFFGGGGVGSRAAR
jgi:hypothetical protein